MAFFVILQKLLALFVLIGLGFFARRYMNIEKESISKLIFYILVPIVFFDAISKLNPSPSLFLLPLITASLSTLVAVIAYTGGRYFFDSSHKSIIAFASANSNVGYFLLPLVWALFDKEAAGVFVIMVLGNVIYENSIGFFIASRGVWRQQILPTSVTQNYRFFW